MDIMAEMPQGRVRPLLGRGHRPDRGGRVGPEALASRTVWQGSCWRLRPGAI